MYYTYVLQSLTSGRWYTGSTGDLRKRLTIHNQGKTSSIKKEIPFKVIYYEACIDEGDARSREKYLKTGNGKRYMKARIKRFLSRTG